MMQQKTSLIVTSIASPNAVLAELAQGAQKNGVEFIVIGDLPSPKTFALDGCRFYGLDEQARLPFNFARLCPMRHYARKNIGYLIALSEGTEVIIETDDDNFPQKGFWQERVRKQKTPTSKGAGWINVYRYFSDAIIWPRGLPLTEVRSPPPALDTLQVMESDCPIQQGLADENPDVDAIYRLILPLPQNFVKDVYVALARGSWSPFNSQNTTWWKDAAPLMYLPSYCSFRMTDIWRSFIAQRVAWENGWAIFYHSPTVWQERNEHDLMRDFRDEIPGYTNNTTIKDALAKLSFKTGVANIPENMRQCYRMLAAMKIIDDQELPLLDAWLSDLAAI
jgi:hypothetical protein